MSYFNFEHSHQDVSFDKDQELDVVNCQSNYWHQLQSPLACRADTHETDRIPLASTELSVNTVRHLRLSLPLQVLTAPVEKAPDPALFLKEFRPKSYQVSPFLSWVFNSAATSPLWVSRSAAPPSAIFPQTCPAACWE